MKTEVKFRPRNDFVLVKIIDLGVNEAGIAMPQMSIQGKRFEVVAIGPDVEDLHVGESVLMIGQVGDNYYPLPNSKDLLVIRQENVVLIFEE